MSKKKEKIEVNFESLKSEYDSNFSKLENFSRELKAQIINLLERDKIALGFPVQVRVKSWQSLADKFQRLSHLRFEKALDVQDLVGIRITLLFVRDVEKVCKLIRENLTVKEEYNTQERLKEDQFGYASTHFVIEMPEEWLRVPVLSGFGGLQAEIQVRTLAQHIWAEASHKFQYKQEQNIPPTVRRSIYRASALLETIDLEFERILEQRTEYRSDIQNPGGSEKTGEQILNVDLLESILNSTLPPENKNDPELYSDLLDELFEWNIKTLDVLNKLIEKHLKHVLEEDFSAVKFMLERNPNYDKNTFFNHTGLLRLILSEEFGEPYENYVLEKYQPQWDDVKDDIEFNPH